MRRAVRGFTLVEMMVVIGIIGIIAVIAVPVSRSMRERAEFNGVIRDYQAKLQLARSLAVAAAPHPLLPANTRVRSAGIIMVDQATYRVFVDNDTAPGGEVIVRVVELAGIGGIGGAVRANPDHQILINAPPEIRLNNSGALLAPAAVDVVFQNLGNKGTRSRTMRINLSGMPRIL